MQQSPEPKDGSYTEPETEQFSKENIGSDSNGSIVQSKAPNSTGYKKTLSPNIKRQKPDTSLKNRIEYNTISQQKFVNTFAVIAFLIGIGTGIGGSFIKKTETVKTVELDKTVLVEKTVQGDGLTQAVGFGIAGLAAGTVFFTVAPELVLGSLATITNVVTTTVGGIGSNRRQKDGEGDEYSDGQKNI